MGVFNMWNPNVPPLFSTDLIRPFRDALAPVKGTTVAAIENFAFAPANIRVGETLTWTNVDGVPHTVKAGPEGDGGDFDSGFIGPGQSFSVRFDELGMYPRSCEN